MLIDKHLIILHVGHCKLQQVGEYQLYGNVESMDSVELVDSCREALLLAFSSAKVTCACGVRVCSECMLHRNLKM